MRRGVLWGVLLPLIGVGGWYLYDATSDFPPPKPAPATTATSTAVADKAPEGSFKNFLGLEFVPIRPGRFEMGEPGSGYFVTLTKPYYIGATEVRNQDWNAFRAAVPDYDGLADSDDDRDYIAHLIGKKKTASTEPEYPICYISWLNVQAFIRWLNAEAARRGENWHYRLPSEAEWEYAARCGKPTAFWWGPGYLQGRGNLSGTVGDDIYLENAPVESMGRNPWGLYHVLGNEAEWTDTWYAESLPFRLSRNHSFPLKEKGEATDPTGPKKGTGKILRGGSWFLCDGRNELLCGRVPFETDLTTRAVGFRLVAVPVSNTPQIRATPDTTEIRVMPKSKTTSKKP